MNFMLCFYGKAQLKSEDRLQRTYVYLTRAILFQWTWHATQTVKKKEPLFVIVCEKVGEEEIY